MATHTLTDVEYGDLINAREEALKDNARLQAELVEAKKTDPANRVAPLNELVRAAFEIVRFAVANLNPESTRGWPTKALNDVADRIPTLVDYTSDDGDLATELRSFARDCEAYALQRARMREEKLKADAAAPKGDLNEDANA